jgi:hypothetical protein
VGKLKDVLTPDDCEKSVQTDLKEVLELNALTDRCRTLVCSAKLNGSAYHMPESIRQGHWIKFPIKHFVFASSCVA